MSSTKIGTIISNTLKNGKRLLKLTVLGKNDVQEIEQIAPHGIDSCPPNDTRVLHVETLQRGTCVVVGSINDNQESTEGESRVYSTDADGVLQTFIHLHDDGTIDIGGTTDNMVRYSPLDSGLQSFKSQIQAELALIAAGIATGGGAYSPGTLTVNISNSKIDEIKTL